MHKCKAITSSLSAVGGLCLFIVTPAYAQYTNPYTGTTWNNPMSSFLDTVIMNNRNAAMMRNGLNSNMASSLAAAKSRMLKAGNLKIKNGQATTRFRSPGPFNTEEWITRCGAKTPEMRRQFAGEIALQREIWNQEVSARNADKSDMAALLGVAFVLGWEAHTGGQKATGTQYRWVVNDFRRSLMKDAYFQGMSAADKQYLQEQQMISATDAVRLWRQGVKNGSRADQKAGKESGGRFLQLWWDAPIERLIATPTGFATRGNDIK
jgi:hypothetical protein